MYLLSFAALQDILMRLSNRLWIEILLLKLFYFWPLHQPRGLVNSMVFLPRCAFSFTSDFVGQYPESFVCDDRFDGFSVLPLRDSIDDDDDPDELGLCSFSAVQLYLKRTEQFRPGCKCLFISTGRNKKEVLKNTISFWLHEVMKRAYQSSAEDSSPS